MRSLIQHSEFPDGFTEQMTRRDMSIVYKSLDPQVHDLVDFLLGREGDGLIGRAHRLLDTPALAIRALQLNIGKKLPRYEHGVNGVEPVGETRAIEEHDQFTIVGGPSTAYRQHGFVTVFHRTATVDQLDSHTRTRLLNNDFHDIPMRTV